MENSLKWSGQPPQGFFMSIKKRRVPVKERALRIIHLDKAEEIPHRLPSAQDRQQTGNHIHALYAPVDPA